MPDNSREELREKFKRFCRTEQATDNLVTLITSEKQKLIEQCEEVLQLGDGHGEVHVSHVCPRDNVECAMFAQRSQTRHHQRQALSNLKKELEA